MVTTPAGFKGGYQALAGGEPDPDALKKAGTDQVNALAALRGTLEAAAIDTERFRQNHAGYEWLVDQLHNLLLAILVVRESIESGRDDQPGRPLITAPENLRTMLDEIEGRTAPPCLPVDGWW